MQYKALSPDFFVYEGKICKPSTVYNILFETRYIYNNNNKNFRVVLLYFNKTYLHFAKYNLFMTI